MHLRYMCIASCPYMYVRMNLHAYSHTQFHMGNLHAHSQTQFHMGNCAEDTAKKYDISRAEQDEYAQRSYTNSSRATEEGVLSKEIVPVAVPQKKGKPDVVVKVDEEFSR